MNNHYDMLCNNCGEKFELECTINEYSEGNHECPECFSIDTQRDWSASNRIIVNDITRFRKGEYGCDDKR